MLAVSRKPTFQRNPPDRHIITIGGSPTINDTVTIQMNVPWPYSPAFITKTHTVLSTSEQPVDMANDLVSQINHDSTLSLFLTASNMQFGSAVPAITLISKSQTNQTYNIAVTGAITETIALSDMRNQTVQMNSSQYNSVWNKKQAIDPAGRTTSYVYASNSIDVRQKLETLGSDNFQIGAWTYAGPVAHLPDSFTDGSGQQTHYTYTSFGQPMTITDANSNVTTLYYPETTQITVGGTISNNHIQTITVTDPVLGTHNPQAVTYTEHTGDTTTTIAAGLAAAINGNTFLQIASIVATSSANVITIVSNSPNLTALNTTATGTITLTPGATNYGYLTKIDGPLTGNKDITTFSYDGYGRLYTATDSEGYTLTYSYDAMNRPTQTTYPDGTTEATQWSNLDPVLMTDRDGRSTRRSYDVLQQLSFEVDPLGRKTQYTWCTCGSLVSLIDPAGHTTSWSHDLQGRTTLKTYQDSTTVAYSYDPYIGRLASKTDALNQTTSYSYYQDNTQFQTSYANVVNATGVVTSGWDSNFKRLANIAKSDWGAYAYTYNPYIIPGGSATTGGGRLQLVHNNVIGTSDTTYSYDVLGRTTNRSINGASNSESWTYDAVSRVTEDANLLAGSGNQFIYAYVDDIAGSSKGTTRLLSVTNLLFASLKTFYNWYPTNGDERLQSILNLGDSSKNLSQYGYRYDSAGQITQWQQQYLLQNDLLSNSTSTLNYNLGYDQGGQLTSVQASPGGPSSAYQSQNYYSYDQASNRTAAQSSSITKMTVIGLGNTGETWTIVVHDPGLTGGQESVTYSWQTGDTPVTVAAGLAAAVTADSNLQALGVNAATNGAVISLKSTSSNPTTYSQTENIAYKMPVGVIANFVENVVIGGTITSGDTVSLTINDNSAGNQTISVVTGGSLATVAASLTSGINANTNLSAAGITATSLGAVVTIKSASQVATTYTQSTSAGATETVSLSFNQNGPQTIAIGGSKTTGNTITINVYDTGLTGGLEPVTYTVLSGDTLTSIASGVASAINADTHLQGIGVSATSAATVATLSSTSINPTTLRASTSTGATETVALNIPANGTQTAAIAGTITAGDVLTLTTYDAGLTGGSQSVGYTVLSTDTLSTTAAGLAAAINANSSLSNIGVSSSANSSVVNIKSTSISATSYAKSTSGGATETITLAPATGVSSFSYNSVNELTGIAPGGATNFQAITNKAIKSATVNSAAAALTWQESFNGNASLTSGANSVPVSATDGGNNVKTNNYQVSVSGPSTSSLSYDANGNMTGDGTNLYVWDAENRLIQVTYSSGNNSQFIYDPLSGLVKIVEVTSGSVTSTKQFVRCGSEMCEQRDASSSVTGRFFQQGETGSGSSGFLYTKDHLGSIRDVTSGGVMLAHYEYDPYGRATQTAINPSGYSGEAGRVFRSYSATQNDSGRPPAKGHVRQP